MDLQNNSNAFVCDTSYSYSNANNRNHQITSQVETCSLSDEYFDILFLSVFAIFGILSIMLLTFVYNFVARKN